MPASIQISTTSGPLWSSSKPTPSYSGLILSAINSSHAHIERQNRNVSVERRRHHSGKYPHIIFSLIAFDASGERIATVDERGHLFIICIRQNRYEFIRNIKSQVTALCFSSIRRSELMLALSDKSIICCDIDTKAILCTLKGHKFKVNNFAFAPHDGMFLSCSKEGVLLWDTHSFKKIKTLSSKTIGLTRAVFTARAGNIVTCLKNEFYVWDAREYKFLYKLSTPSEDSAATNDSHTDITAFDISLQEKYLIAGGNSEPFLYIWDLSSHQLIKTMRFDGDGASKIKVSPKSDRFAILTTCGKLMLVDLLTLKVDAVINSIYEEIMDFDIDKGWSLLTTVMNSGTLILYDLEVVLQHHMKLGELTKKGSMNGDTMGCSLESENSRALKTNNDELDASYLQPDGCSDNGDQEDNSVQAVRRVIPNNLDTTTWNKSFSQVEKIDPFEYGTAADSLKLTKLEVLTDG